jgi:hypothetical protein
MSGEPPFPPSVSNQWRRGVSPDVGREGGVTDDDLRASLEADAAEMAACPKARAYKAVRVLAGSIVEALLTDNVDSTGNKDPRGTDLGDLGRGPAHRGRLLTET